MAELPEVWSDKTPDVRPDTTPARRSLFDRTPTFGLAQAAELLGGELPAPPVDPAPNKPRREHGPFLTHLLLPWSYGDRVPGDRWHQFRCRIGRHAMIGGHAMQLDSTEVFVERRCRYCGAG
jgi:hypothetical protein